MKESLRSNYLPKTWVSDRKMTRWILTWPLSLPLPTPFYAVSKSLGKQLTAQERASEMGIAKSKKVTKLRQFSKSYHQAGHFFLKQSSPEREINL
jgi:hypothetical protein